MVRQRAEGPSRRLIQFAIEDEAAMLHHDEPIYRNGLRVGAITSGGWGHHLGAAVGMGYAKVDEPGLINGPWVRESDWAIEIAGRSFPARASLLPLYDPKSHRVRG
ncbi:MAG: glycine cleavage T C-terminal barrel domain-containing protein [Myxococcota bacterium]